MIQEINIKTSATGVLDISIAKMGDEPIKPWQAILYLVEAMKQISAEASKQNPQTTTIKQY